MGGKDLAFTPITQWYLGIGVEPLGGRHQQLPFHAVKGKGQDCPGLLGMRGTRWKTWDPPLRYNHSWPQSGCVFVCGGELLFLQPGPQVASILFEGSLHITPSLGNCSRRDPITWFQQGFPKHSILHERGSHSNGHPPVPPSSALFSRAGSQQALFPRFPCQFGSIRNLVGDKEGRRKQPPGPHRSLGHITCHSHYGDGVAVDLSSQARVRLSVSIRSDCLRLPNSTQQELASGFSSRVEGVLPSSLLLLQLFQHGCCDQFNPPTTV